MFLTVYHVSVYIYSATCKHTHPHVKSDAALLYLPFDVVKGMYKIGIVSPLYYILLGILCDVIYIFLHLKAVCSWKLSRNEIFVKVVHVSF